MDYMCVRADSSYSLCSVFVQAYIFIYSDVETNICYPQGLILYSGRKFVFQAAFVKNNVLHNEFGACNSEKHH